MEFPGGGGGGGGGLEKKTIHGEGTCMDIFWNYTVSVYDLCRLSLDLLRSIKDSYTYQSLLQKRH